MSTTLHEVIVSGQSAKEFVRRLTPEQKEAVLAAILQEAILLTGGKGLIPLNTPDGEPLGYYVPPDAAAELTRKWGPQPTAEDRERSQRALANLDDTFDVTEILNEADAANEPR